MVIAFDVTALTKGISMTSFVIPEVPPGAPVQVTLNFPFEDFLRTDYVGNWFYSLTWAGQAMCAAAMPPVVKTSLRLERGGQSIVSADGVSVDGTPKACVDGSNEVINKLPWGPANLTVIGLDASGTPQFQETFPTFIGAGILNPTLKFDVDSLAPDAGVPDAGVPDAAIDAGPDAT